MPVTAEEFRIDPERLDTEWLKQPQLSRKLGEEEADARHAQTRAKNRLALVEAQLTLRVRKNPQAYGLDKATEASIAAAVTEHSEYQSALREYEDATHKANLASALTTAAVDRRKSLENLVELQQLNYIAERGPRDKSERVFGDGIDLDRKHN